MVFSCKYCAFDTPERYLPVAHCMIRAAFQYQSALACMSIGPHLPPVFAGGQGLGALSVLAGKLQAKTPACDRTFAGSPMSWSWMTSKLILSIHCPLREPPHTPAPACVQIHQCASPSIRAFLKQSTAAVERTSAASDAAQRHYRRTYQRGRGWRSLQAGSPAPEPVPQHWHRSGSPAVGTVHMQCHYRQNLLCLTDNMSSARRSLVSSVCSLHAQSS